MTRLLVITATLGRSRHLLETIDSVRRTGLPIRHFVVCPDAAAGELEAVVPAGQVIKEKPGMEGLYGALNHGVASAGTSWEWVTYINDDDVLMDGIRDAWNIATGSDKLDLVYGKVVKIGEAGPRLGWVSTLRTPRHFLPLASGRISGFNQQGVLIRRRLWERMDGFDTSYKIVGDFDFFVRAALSGARLEYVPAFVGGFRIREGQISQDVALERAELDRLIARNGLAFPALERLRAQLLFRLQNVDSYLSRLRRRDFRSSRQVLAGQ